MPERSAGLLLHRSVDGRREVLIAHMGGPFWAGRDEAAWSIPKGLYDDSESPLDAALREFAEELGIPAPDADYEMLGEFRQPSGKLVTVYIAEANLTLGTIVSNTFTIEWPPRSGRMQDFPEIDAAAWLDLATARTKLVKGQRSILDALEIRLGS
ncbi:NUDIX domain-containing protein [soil metagenome]